jgi:ABC-type transport system involved in multi-copper enzyme maturation permease subunit
MLEIFKMQVGQILGGRRRWLVLLGLLLPVLLSLTVVLKADLGRLERRHAEDVRHREIARQIPGPPLERIRWRGEDLAFVNGQVLLTRDGVSVAGQVSQPGWTMVDRQGRLILKGEQLWIDRSRIDAVRFEDLNWFNVASLEDPNDFGAGPPPRTLYAIFLFLVYPQVMCLLLSLLYGTGVLGHELDNKTLPYLFTRPLRRWQFVLGKYLGIVAALAIPTSASLAAAWAILTRFNHADVLGGVLLGTLGALLAYNAVFILLGFITPRRAMIAALLYGILFELVLSFVPALINQITVTYYLRSLVAGAIGLELPREVARSLGEASVALSWVALTVIIAVTLSAASLMAARREYVVKDDA